MATLRMAIIGAGVWGEVHAHLYHEHPEAEVCAVCDRDMEKAQRLGEQFGIAAIYDDHQDMLANEAIDAVAIVTPDHLHGQLAVDCANAGKHILLEKPLATTLADVKAIAAAVRSSGVRCMVDLHNRWSPPFAVTKESVDRGELGRPVSAYFRLNDIQWVATDMLPWAAASSILWFLGPHTVDTLRWMFSDEVKQVYTVSTAGILRDKGVDTVDMYQTILQFRGGGIATAENGWITPNSHPCINDIKFNVTGTKGMISLDLSNSQMIERFTDERSDRPDVLVKHFVHGKPKGFAYESIRHFVDCLASGDPFLVSFEDAVNTSLVILAMLESAETGAPVTVSYDLA